MALSGARLGTAFKTIVKSRMEALGVPAPALIDDQTWDDLAQAIIDEFTAFAEVATVVTVTSVTGVTAGAGVSGPGTGSGVGAPGSIT